MLNVQKTFLRHGLLFSAVYFLCFLFMNSLSADHFVDVNSTNPQSPYTTQETAATNIQGAINVASANAIIRVAPGTYTLPQNAVDFAGMNVVYIDKPLSIIGSSGNPADTIIDGQGTNRGIAIRYPQSTNDSFIIQGLGIRNCHAQNTGGGMVLSSGNYGWDLRISNCDFIDNTVAWGANPGSFLSAGSRGGAIGNNETQPPYTITITDCVFKGNTAEHGGTSSGNPGEGGAVYLRTGYQPVSFNSCVFEDNTATAGGALVNLYPNLTVEKCIFKDNSSIVQDSGVSVYSITAGGIYVNYGSTLLRNCLAYGNNSDGRAGFLYSTNNFCTIENCTIVQNSSSLYGYPGGVFSRYDGSTLIMKNSIIYSNIGNNWLKANALNSSAMNNCCTSPITGLPGTGNISSDPALSTVEDMEYHLTSSSPCIDAGLNEAWMDANTDLSGISRRFSTVDMGCYERAYLVNNNQAYADIVISATCPRMVTLAAEELQEYIQKITGVQLAINTTENTNLPFHIYVGRSNYTDALGLTNTNLLYGAFTMETGNNWLALFGYDEDYTPTGPYPSSSTDITRMLAEWDNLTGTTWGTSREYLYKRHSSEYAFWEMDKRGSLNAVYEYLHKLGVRWFFPGSLGEVLPQSNTIVFTATDKVVNPDFKVREMYQYYNQFWTNKLDEILWQLRLGLNSGEEIFGGTDPIHGIKDVIERSEMKTAHPEYYAIWDGVRQTAVSAPCLYSSGLLSQNINYCQAVYNINAEPMVSVMPSDGYTRLCECGACSGKSTPTRGYDGLLSDYVWGYVNQVAGALYSNYPDKKVMCGAYTTYLLPPLNITSFSPNVSVYLCRWSSNFYNQNTFNYYKNMTNEWLSKLPSQDLYVYDYYLHSERADTIGVPVYFPHTIDQDVKFLKGKANGVFIEVQRNWEGWERNWHALATNHLNLYIVSRLLWDADIDVEDILDDYYEKFYGPVETQMRAFVNYCEANWPNMRTDKNIMLNAINLLEAARTAASGTGVYSQRVEMIYDFMQPVYVLYGQMSDKFVNINSTNPQSPYTTQETAATNIQDAINASSANAIIRVAPGTYTLPANHVDFAGNNVVYIDKPLSIIGTSGNPGDTIIDGQGSNRGIAIRYPESTSNSFIIENLTIQNCYAQNTGGGMVLSSGNYGWDLQINNCRFIGNAVAWGENPGYFLSAGSRGGAIGCCETQPGYTITVNNSVFDSNSAQHGGTASGNPGEGGAIYLRTGYQPVSFFGCTFENNTATSGGALFQRYPDLLMEKCIFKNNSSVLSDSGVSVYSITAGGISLEYGEAVLRNCLAYENSSEGKAGFFYGAYNLCTIENCTIVNNICSLYGYPGGVLSRFDTARLTMKNSIIYANIGGNWQKTGVLNDSSMNNCCTSPITGLPGTGNINTDPLLSTTPGSEYHLTSSSPCIDAGVNETWMEKDTDLNNAPRIDTVSDVVDMGAYEYQQ